MIKKIKLNNDLIQVSSDKGMVDIGQGPVKTIICHEEELQYIKEVIEK